MSRILISSWLKEIDPILSATRPRNVHSKASLFAMTQYRVARHFTIQVEISRAINVKAMLEYRSSRKFYACLVPCLRDSVDLQFLSLTDGSVYTVDRISKTRYKSGWTGTHLGITQAPDIILRVVPPTSMAVLVMSIAI